MIHVEDTEGKTEYLIFLVLEVTPVKHANVNSLR